MHFNFKKIKPWLRKNLDKSNVLFVLEDEVEAKYNKREACELPQAAFFSQFNGNGDMDEVRRLSAKGDYELAAEVLLESGRDRYSPIVFLLPGEADRLIPNFLNDQDYCRQIIRQANLLIRHTFNPWGDTPYTFASSIDWFSDLHGESWPKAHVKDLNDCFTGMMAAPSLPVAPRELTWSLNEHSHFLTLAKAYWLTNNGNYASEFMVQATDWARCNPPEMGINWIDDETIAYRTVNWLIALNMFIGAEQVAPELYSTLSRCLMLHGAVIARRLHSNPDQNSPALASALYMLSACNPEIKITKRWFNLSSDMLKIAIKRTFTEDGLHISGSPSQHRLACEWLILPVLLQVINNTRAPQFLEDATALALDALNSLTAQHGHGNDIGPRVHQRGFLGHFCSSTEHAQRILALGSLTLRTRKWCSQLEKLPAEVFWWYGPNAEQSFNQLNLEVPDYTAQIFPCAGLACLRNDWSDKCVQLIFKGIPDNTPLKAREEADKALYLARDSEESPKALPVKVTTLTQDFHDDLLSFTLVAEGEPLILEPGMLPSPLSNSTFMGRLALHSAPAVHGEYQPINPLTGPLGTGTGRADAPCAIGTPAEHTPEKSEPDPQPQAKTKAGKYTKGKGISSRFKQEPEPRQPLTDADRQDIPISIKRQGDDTLIWSRRTALMPNGQIYYVKREILFRPQEKYALIRDTVTGDAEKVRYDNSFILSPHLYLNMRGDMGCAIRGHKLRAKLIPILPRGSHHYLNQNMQSPSAWFISEQNAPSPATYLHYSAELPLPARAYYLISWTQIEPPHLPPDKINGIFKVFE